MTVSISTTAFHVLELETRMPFHFGNVGVTRVPKVFLRVLVDVDGESQEGVSMGGLIPGWFYKDPEMNLEAGLRSMMETFHSAAAISRSLDPAPTPFDFWQQLYAGQREWAATTDHPPLLWGYGVSMVEQALLDAVCRHGEMAFGTAVRENRLGIDLGSIYEELEGHEPNDFLPDESLETTAVRHTVGLDDPLVSEDIAPDDRLADGLPRTLATYICESGVHHFKIKLSADQDADETRLIRIAELLEELGVDEYVCTVDANEGYASPQEFKRQWESHASTPGLAALFDQLAYVEQPLARDSAFSPETRAVFDGWEDAPPIIIDESDGRIDSAGTAIDYGYAGTSHKNCKGVFKGIANACLVAHRNQTDPDQEYVLSAEDLTTTGPVELLQDLAVIAALGADHVERNGHHYFRGLNAFPETIQASLLEAHGDLYRRHEDGFATLDIQDGTIRLASVIDAPFGAAPCYETSQFTPADEWLESLGDDPSGSE